MSGGFIDTIKSYLESLSPRNKYIGIGFFIGLLTPCTVTILAFLIKKLKKVRREQMRTYVGIQLGGTNYNVAIGCPEFDRKGKLMNFTMKKQTDGRTSDDPSQTIRQITDFLNKNEPPNSLFGFDFVGIASFGPLSLNESSKNYGHITTTPKTGWKNFPLLTLIENKVKATRFNIQTDVNAAAFAQFKLGNHKCTESLVYVTIGTGVGVGVITQGKTLHGLTHPEGGHIMVKKSEKEYENFNGVCPYHQNCLEGMVANKSIGKRLNIDYTQLHELEDSQLIWQILGDYLGQLCLNLTLTLSPQVIVIGGGVMNRKILYKYTRKSFLKYLAQYVENELFTEKNIQSYIKEPKLGNQVGVKGAMILNFVE